MRTDLISLDIDAVGLKSCSLTRSSGMNLNACIALGSSVGKSCLTKQTGMAEHYTALQPENNSL